MKKLALGVVITAAVAAAVGTPGYLLSQHLAEQDRLQAAYDWGRIDQARYRNRDNAWREGRDWALRFGRSYAACAEAIDGGDRLGKPIPPVPDAPNLRFDWQSGCGSGVEEIQRGYGRTADEKRVYDLGFLGLNR